MLVPKPSKYKSIGVNVDTYEKIVQIANKERRNISQQLSLLVDEEYRSQCLQKTTPPVARAMVGGISEVIEDKRRPALPRPPSSVAAIAGFSLALCLMFDV